MRRIKHEEDLLPALKTNILADLDRLYEETLQQILSGGNVARRWVIQIFSWILYMKSPLTPSALVAALSITNDSTKTPHSSEISNICANLIVVDSKRDLVGFAHQSIMEFLLRSKQEFFSPSVSHALIASTCIDVCSVGPPDGHALAAQITSLYFYAAVYWASHVKSASVVETRDDLFRKILGFIVDEEDMESSLSFEVWMSTAADLVALLPNDNPMKPSLEAIPNDTASPIFLAAVFDIDGLLQLLAESNVDTDWNQRNNLGQTALYLAAALGHESAVSILIEQGAEMDINCGRYGSPLHAACFGGHVNVVQRLLQENISTTCGTTFETAIDAAIHGGHEEIALIVIQHGSIICDATYEKALQSAAESGFSRVIDELQKPNYITFRGNGKIDKQKMRISKAIKGGQLGVLQNFLNNTTSPLEILPIDAVAIAASYGHNDIIRLLLEKDADVEAKGTFGTPLRSACLMNRKSTVQLLISTGAATNAASLGDALYSASLQGHANIVTLLIREGADVNHRTGTYKTALHAAAYKGHKDVVEILIGAGANVHAPGLLRDVFHTAAAGGHQDIVLLLLEKGYEFYHTPPGPSYCLGTPSQYKQLFRQASPSRKEGSRQNNGSKVEDDVLSEAESDSDSDIYTEGSREDHPPSRPECARGENYPLEVSAAAGNLEVVRILIDQRETIGISLEAVKGAMIAAAANGHLGILEILLDSVAQFGPITSYFSLILKSAKTDNQHKVLDFVLKTASEKFPAEVIDKLRLDLPPGPEKYKVAVIGKGTLRSDFITSCQYGDINAVTSILESSHKTFLRSGDLTKGLELAVKNGHQSLLVFLLGHEAFQQPEINLDKPCVAAGETNQLECLKSLLPRKYELQRSMPLLKQILFAACTGGHPDIVSYLVADLEVDVNSELVVDSECKALRHDFRIFEDAYQNSSEDSSTSSSSENGSDQISSEQGVPLKDELGISSNEYAASQIHRSENSSSGSVKTQQREEDILEQNNQDRDDSGEHPTTSPLQATLRAFFTHSLFGTMIIENSEECLRRTSIVKFLLGHGADPNCLAGQDDYPIQIAAKLCPDIVVGLLIDAGADIVSVHKGESALTAAIGRELESASILRRLLKAGASFPLDDDEASRLIIKRLLKFFSGDPEREYFHDSGDPDGRFLWATSLTYVFQEGPGAVLEQVLRHYSEIRTNDIEYHLVLQMVCVLGKQDFVELLLSRGTDPNGPGYYYGSPLQAAARNGQYEIVQILLQHGANVNMLQGRWQTPLRAAIMSGNSSVVQLLISHAANFNLKYKTQRLYVNDSEKTSASVLQLALEVGNIDTMKLLLAAGADPSEDTSYLPHPLIMCCQQGRVDIAHLLLQAGTCVNISGRKRKYRLQVAPEDASPLHAAISGGHTQLVELLLSSGADVDREVTECDETPLMTAIQKRNLVIIRVLLDAGAEVNHISKQGTALQEAVRTGDIVLVRELLAAGAVVANPKAVCGPSKQDDDDPRHELTETSVPAASNVQPNCLVTACCQRDPDIVELLLDNIYQSNNYSEAIVDEALTEVVRQQPPSEAFLCLLLDYLPPSPQRLLQICASGSASTVTSMLDQGLDPDGQVDGQMAKDSPIHVAARNLRARVVHTLVQRGANIHLNSVNSRTPLMVALLSCARPCLRAPDTDRVMTLGKEIPSSDDLDLSIQSFHHWGTPRSGFQPIQLCMSIVQLLLMKGAKTDVDDCAFGEPIHVACLIGSTAIVQLLIDNGADVNAVSGYFETPLFAAIKGNYLDIVSLLLEKGADVSHIHQEYGTPLHYVCSFGSKQAIARKLLQHGASATIPNRNGETPFTLALKEHKDLWYRDFSELGDESDQSLFDIIQAASQDLQLSDEDILAAAEVSGYTGILASMFERNRDVVVSEDLIVRFLEQVRWIERDNLKLLFQRSGGLGITERMLMAAPDVTTLREMMNYLNICKITPEILEKQKDLGSMELLLEIDKDAKVTEAVAVRALELGGRYASRSIGRWSTSKIWTLPMLWERNPSLLVTQAMLKAVRSPDELEFLLQRSGPSTGTLQDVVFHTVNNDSLRGDESANMLSLLIRHDSEIKLTPDLVAKTMWCFESCAPLDAFLTHDSGLAITESLFLKIFGVFPTARDYVRKEFADILLKHGKKFIFTQGIRDAIDGAYQKNSDLEIKHKFYSLRERDETVEEAEIRGQREKNEKRNSPRSSSDSPEEFVIIK